MPSLHQRGQASVELLIVLPLLALVLAAAWQVLLLGHAAWAAGAAARAAARAQAIGSDPRPAAAEALPPGLERGMGIRRIAEGGVEVALRVPSVLPGLTPGVVRARSALPRQVP